MHILVAPGIGDLVWSMLKVQDLANKHGHRAIDLRIACWHINEVESRALEFAKKFQFVNSVSMYVMPSHNRQGPLLMEGAPADENGYYRYIADGHHPELKNIDYLLMPNAALEKGIRIEDWLPELEINWNIMDEFVFTDIERNYAKQLKEVLGEYVVFFMASQASNTTSGHNRNGLWKPQDWIELGDRLHEMYGVKILVVGTTWDLDYYNNNIRPCIKSKRHWTNYIAQWPIGHTFSVIKDCRFMISYQSGLMNVAHYMGVPGVEFWRPKGDSLSSDYYISFDESMATAWADPRMLEQNKFMGAIYGKHGVNEILDFIKNNRW